MIEKEDLKVGSFLRIRKVDLKNMAGTAVFIEEMNPNNIYDSIVVEVVDVVNGWCKIPFPKRNEFIYIDVDELAKVSVFASEPASESANKKTDSDRFKEITDKMCNTFEVKNLDYGDSFHKLFEECGMTYAYGHMAEKLERINSLRKNDAKVKGESMKDSLYDLANYAILTIMELEKTEK